MTVTTVTCQMTDVTAADILTFHSSIIITDVIADVTRIWVIFFLYCTFLIGYILYTVTP